MPVVADVVRFRRALAPPCSLLLTIRASQRASSRRSAYELLHVVAGSLSMVCAALRGSWCTYSFRNTDICALSAARSTAGCTTVLSTTRNTSTVADRSACHHSGAITSTGTHSIPAGRAAAVVWDAMMSTPSIRCRGTSRRMRSTGSPATTIAFTDDDPALPMMPVPEVTAIAKLLVGDPRA